MDNEVMLLGGSWHGKMIHTDLIPARPYIELMEEKEPDYKRARSTLYETYKVEVYHLYGKVKLTHENKTIYICVYKGP